jgi:hypothetical protein
MTFGRAITARHGAVGSRIERSDWTPDSCAQQANSLKTRSASEGSLQRALFGALWVGKIGTARQLAGVWRSRHDSMSVRRSQVLKTGNGKVTLPS